jgi:hypothetical protein
MFIKIYAPDTSRSLLLLQSARGRVAAVLNDSPGRAAKKKEREFQNNFREQLVVAEFVIANG